MNALAGLFKIKIAAMASLSAAIGWLLAGGTAGVALVLPTLATLLLACGSAALNELQEWRLDARMARTRERPIPAGRITPGAAAGISAALIALGLAGLAVSAGWLAASLGALAVVWYNGVYTPLKRRTPYAAVIGAPVGAIPPAVGWVAAGGHPGAPALHALMLFLFLWQVPHFWLLLLAREGEYRAAGLPSMTGVFSPPRLRRITFSWTLALAAAASAFPLVGIARQPWAYALLLLLTAHQAVRATVLLRAGAEPAPAAMMSAFNRLNVYTLLVLALVALDRGVGTGRF